MDKSDICLIFDLDGTLVDSESICNQVFIDLIPKINDPLITLVNRYHGHKLADIFQDLESRYDITLSSNFEKIYRKKLYQLITTKLQPFPGVFKMLDSLKYQKCIASNGPLKKIKLSLKICNLDKYFGNRVFSAYEISSWKPDPEILLYAARKMGFLPNKCIVIDDSVSGMIAAKTSGMKAVRFSSEEMPFINSDYSLIKNFDELPQLIEKLMSNI